MNAPAGDELAAIVAALAAGAHGTQPASPRAPSAWALAARFPDLEIEEVLALRHASDAAACSARF